MSWVRIVVGMSALLIALLIIKSATAQEVGRTVRCSDGSLAYGWPPRCGGGNSYNSGNTPCGYNFECYPGNYCAGPGKCFPIGSTNCGSYYCQAGQSCCNGRCCFEGFRCGSHGQCIPAEAVDCGNGQSCPEGTVCVPRGEFDGKLDDKCPTPDQLAEIREMFETIERSKVEERERKRQEAIAERERKEEERKEAKRQKEQEQRDAAKARSEARQAERDKQAREAEAARDRSNHQAIARDRAVISSGIAPSSQLGSAQSAAQILQDLRKDSVLSRMGAGSVPADQMPRVQGEQRRLVTRQTPSPAPTISPGGAPNASIAASPPPDEKARGSSSARSIEPKPASSWVQDFSLNKLDPNNIPEDAKKEIEARLEEERKKIEKQEQAKNAEAEKVYQETFGREAAKQPAPKEDKSTPWTWIVIRTDVETSSRKCWRPRVNMDPQKGGLFRRPSMERKCDMKLEVRTGADGNIQYGAQKKDCHKWYCAE